MPHADAAIADAECAPERAEVAGIYANYAAGFEHSLVVVAQGWPCWLEEDEGGHRLLVEADLLNAARAQLAAYDRESANWPPKPVVDPASRREVALLGPLAWAVAVLAIFSGQGRNPAWTEWGALDAAAVFDGGEVWRAGTALFLHADAEHVIANAFAGVCAFSAVLTTFGRGRGWGLLALAGVVGNLVAAALGYPGPYSSLGASTAIFGAVGLLTGRAVRRVQTGRDASRWRPLFVPLAAGFTVLALHGAGGESVDVGAHVTGFAAGLAAGFVAAATYDTAPMKFAG